MTLTASTKSSPRTGRRPSPRQRTTISLRNKNDNGTICRAKSCCANNGHCVTVLSVWRSGVMPRHTYAGSVDIDELPRYADFFVRMKRPISTRNEQALQNAPGIWACFLRSCFPQGFGRPHPRTWILEARPHSCRKENQWA